jgi:hypothetical protein
MRKRFKINRVCSSDNYRLSKKIHTLLLNENHENNKEYFNRIKDSVISDNDDKILEYRILRNLKKWHDEGNRPHK